MIDDKITQFCTWVLLCKGRIVDYVPLQDEEGDRHYLLLENLSHIKIYEISESDINSDFEEVFKHYENNGYSDWFSPGSEYSFVEESIEKLALLKNYKFTIINLKFNKVTKEILNVLSTWDLSEVYCISLGNENLITREDVLAFFSNTHLPKLKFLYLEKYKVQDLKKQLNAKIVEY